MCFNILLNYWMDCIRLLNITVRFFSLRFLPRLPPL